MILVCYSNSDFRSFSVSAVNVNDSLVGRPYGGVSVLWRKSRGNCFQMVSFHDPRILGFTLSLDSRSMVFLNVYLSYYSVETTDEYLDYLRKLESIIDGVGGSELSHYGRS